MLRFKNFLNEINEKINVIYKKSLKFSYDPKDITLYYCVKYVSRIS
jgi:phage-related protein